MPKKESIIKQHEVGEFFLVRLNENHVRSYELSQGKITNVSIRPITQACAHEFKTREVAQDVVDYLGAGQVIRVVSTYIHTHTHFYE